MVEIDHCIVLFYMKADNRLKGIQDNFLLTNFSLLFAADVSGVRLKISLKK